MRDYAAIGLDALRECVRDLWGWLHFYVRPSK